jgi:hypothetical protein
MAIPEYLINSIDRLIPTYGIILSDITRLFTQQFKDEKYNIPPAFRTVHE